MASYILNQCIIEKVNSNINSRIWMIIMCHFGFKNCSTDITLDENVDNVGVWKCGIVE